MKHVWDDGRGQREVWLDGFMLERVVECDDDVATAVVIDPHLRVVDGDVIRHTLKGDCLVVLRIQKNSI